MSMGKSLRIMLHELINTGTQARLADERANEPGLDLYTLAHRKRQASAWRARYNRDRAAYLAEAKGDPE